MHSRLSVQFFCKLMSEPNLTFCLFENLTFQDFVNLDAGRLV